MEEREEMELEERFGWGSGGPWGGGVAGLGAAQTEFSFLCFFFFFHWGVGQPYYDRLGRPGPGKAKPTALLDGPSACMRQDK